MTRMFSTCGMSIRYSKMNFSQKSTIAHSCSGTRMKRSLSTKEKSKPGRQLFMHSSKQSLLMQGFNMQSVELNLQREGLQCSRENHMMLRRDWKT